MIIDPKTCRLYVDKFDIRGIPAPDYLVDFLKKHTTTGLNKYRRIRRGSDEQFTDTESVALAITFGKFGFKAKLDRAADPNDETRRVTVMLDEPVKVEVVDKRLQFTKGAKEIEVTDQMPESTQ